MNIQRFVLPATIAATLHVALLWALPREEYTRIITIPLKPVPPAEQKPEEVAPPPEEKPTTADEPVKSLAGGPTPPDIPEDMVPRKSEVPSIPVEHAATKPTSGVTVIPAQIGNGDPTGLGGIGQAGVPVFAADQLDRRPNAKVQMAPDYPFALKREGIEGSVVVEFDVDRSGQVTSARVVRSSHREFEEPTLRAVRKWRFEPGRRNGQAVSFRMQVPVDFHVE